MKEVKPSEYLETVTEGRITIDVTFLDGQVELKADKAYPVSINGSPHFMKLESYKYGVFTFITLSVIDCIR